MSQKNSLENKRLRRKIKFLKKLTVEHNKVKYRLVGDQVLPYQLAPRDYYKEWMNANTEEEKDIIVKSAIKEAFEEGGEQNMDQTGTSEDTNQDTLNPAVEPAEDTEETVAGEDVAEAETEDGETPSSLPTE